MANEKTIKKIPNFPPMSLYMRKLNALEDEYEKGLVDRRPELPRRRSYEDFFFFYGALMDPEVLQRFLNLHERPQLLPCKTIGYSCMLWGEGEGEYPVLVDGRPGEPVYGMAYKIQAPEEANRLKEEAKRLKDCYEMDQFEVGKCNIIVEGEDEEILANTFNCYDLIVIAGSIEKAWTITDDASLKVDKASNQWSVELVSPAQEYKDESLKKVIKMQTTISLTCRASTNDLMNNITTTATAAVLCLVSPAFKHHLFLVEPSLERPTKESILALSDISSSIIKL
ncbi:hypothetical protein B7463_g1322, partial [Scytalidium lignicola]